MSRSPFAACLALVVGVFGLSAGAERRPSSSERLVGQVMEPAITSLEALASERVDVGVALRFQAPTGMGKAATLESTIAQLVSGRLARRPSLRHETIVALPDSRRENLEQAAEVAGHDYLLLLDFFVDGRYAHLVGTLWRVRANFWTRVKEPIGGVRHHFYGRVRVDAPLRTQLDLAVRPLSLELQPGPAAPRGALAVASGDFDGDDLQELVWLTRDVVKVQRWRGAQAEAVGEWALDGLARSPVRLRRPWGTVVATDLVGDGTHDFAIWTSDLASGWVLNLSEAGQPEPVMAPQSVSVCGKASRGQTWRLCGPVFGTLMPLVPTTGQTVYVGDVDPAKGSLRPLVRTVTRRGEGAPVRLDGLTRTFASGAWPQRTPGEYTDVLATVDAAGRLLLLSGGRTQRVEGVGAQVALADLNDDGVVDVIRTTDSTPGEPDAVVVHSMGARVKEVFRASVPTVLDLSVGDSDNDAVIDVLVLCDGGVVRRLRAVDET